MHSDDGYSASDAHASINELRDRLGRLERRALGTPQRNAVDLKVEEMLRDKVRYLNEKAKKDGNLIQSLYKRIDEANETAEQFKKAAERFKKDFWGERELGAEAGAEMAKLRKENAELKDAKSPKIGLNGDIHDYYAREVKENRQLREGLEKARAVFIEKDRELEHERGARKKISADLNKYRDKANKLEKKLRAVNAIADADN